MSATHIHRRLADLGAEIEILRDEIEHDAIDPGVSDLWFTTEVIELTELEHWHAAISQEHANA